MWSCVVEMREYRELSGTGGAQRGYESAESRRPEGPGRELGGHEERKKLSLISLLTAIDPQIKGSLERAAQRREPV